MDSPGNHLEDMISFNKHSNRRVLDCVQFQFFEKDLGAFEKFGEGTQIS